jgi:hypothetical protein
MGDSRGAEYAIGQLPYKTKLNAHLECDVLEQF